MQFKLGYKLFKKNLFTSIFIIIQLIVSILLLNVTIGLINSSYAKLNVFTKFDLENTIYYMNNLLPTDEDITNIQKKCSNTLIEPIKYTYMSVDNGMTITYGCAYGEKTSKNLNVRLKKGKWYYDVEKENGIINAVAMYGSNYKLNEIYTILVQNKDASDIDEYKFKITGLVDSSTGLVFGEVGSTAMDANYLFQKFEIGFNGLSDYLLFSSEDKDIKDQLNSTTSLFIYTQEKSQYNNVYNDLKNTGNVISLRGIYNNTMETLAHDVHKYYPVLFAVLISGVIGFIGIIILSNLKNRRTFSIYYVCGMNTLECIKICLSQVFCQLIIVVFCVSLVYLIFNFSGFLFEHNIEIALNNILITLLFFFIIFIVSIISSNYIVTKLNPLDDLKNNM